MIRLTFKKIPLAAALRIDCRGKGRKRWGAGVPVWRKEIMEQGGSNGGK